MALWKDNAKPAPEAERKEPARFDVGDSPAPAAVAESAPASQRATAPSGKESLIASDLTIEGKIEGAGNLRLAGRFKGDVDVGGDLAIEQGARLNGSVKAKRVLISGELEGNIESATRVELQEGGMLVGDLKAGALTVAAGARMRGQVEFGFEDDKGGKGTRSAPGSASGTERGSGG